MAYVTPLFSTLNMSGVDLNAATSYTLATATNFTPEYPQGGNLSLGTTVLGTLDGQWVYATAANSITKYDVVQLSPAFSATTITTATATFGEMAGVAMATASTGQYFWVQVNGIAAAVNTVTGVGANAALYTTATAGRLTGTLTTGVGNKVAGIVLTTGTTGNAAGATVGGILIQTSIGSAQ